MVARASAGGNVVSVARINMAVARRSTIGVSDGNGDGGAVGSMGVLARAVAVARNASPVGLGVRLINGLGRASAVAVARNAMPVGLGVRVAGAAVAALGGIGVSLGAITLGAVALAFGVAVAAGVAVAGVAVAVAVLVLLGAGVGSGVREADGAASVGASAGSKLRAVARRAASARCDRSRACANADPSVGAPSCASSTSRRAAKRVRSW